ncbi:MAG TPA: peptidoglycan-binding protein [Vicinamibacterales bacterium]|jgi:chitosanase
MNDLQNLTCSAIVNVFETGRVRGDYGAIAVLKGDNGHLSYGRSQAALGAGTLCKLLDLYCQQTGGLFTTQIQAVLPRFRTKDVSLDNDTAVQLLLKQAGQQDPVMRATQDQFFNANYLAPAIRDAQAFGVTLPLGQAIIYDSHVQGGWARLRDRIGPPGALGEKAWANNYLALRRTWLQSLAPPLPGTVYRVDSFSDLIAQDNWDLGLPLVVHGVTITPDALAPETPAPGDAPRTLRLTSPYLRGADVQALQQALTTHGNPVSSDGIYGPFTDQLVKQWQTSNAIVEEGVGPATRKSLGL